MSWACSPRMPFAKFLSCISTYQEGIPAIAVSQTPRADAAATAAFTRKFAVEMRKHDPIPGVVWSINAPRTVSGPPAVAPMGGSYLQVRGYRETSEEDGVTTWRSVLGPGPQGPPGCDTALHLSGRITVTPLRFDWTDRRALELAQGWQLQGG